MAIINIRESLNKMDKDTDCKYDLVTLYESLPLTEEDRKDIVKMLYSNEEPEVIYKKIKEKYPYVQLVEDDDISDIEDNYGEDLKYILLATKTVTDSNGFTTDYTWYKDNQTGNNVFVFGDIDYYKPEDAYFDYETENDKVAKKWFDTYNGFEDNESNIYDESLKEPSRKKDGCILDKLNKELSSYKDAYAYEDEYDNNTIIISCGSSNTLRNIKDKYHIDSKHTFDSPVEHSAQISKNDLNKLMSLTDDIPDIPSKNESVERTNVHHTVDYLGRIVIPKEIRKRLEIKEDDRMEFLIDGNDLILRKHNNSVETLPVEENKNITEAIEDTTEDELETAEQKISSAKTSINAKQLPAIFRLAKFKPNTINLDMGGGKFDNAAEELAKVDVTNLVYDPYNRTQEHNNEVVAQIRKNGGADTATISNVLNVIAEPEARQTVLRNTKRLLKPNGTVYITVYEGDRSGEGRETSSGYQLNKPTKDYMEEISKVFPNVQRRGKLIIAS